ncbi:MAG: hypothetical protein FJ096_13365, partial [Deltaproteobacteria bacterium]|nr:hypothetical protein [Deltaproteobacteria bacterium]
MILAQLRAEEPLETDPSQRALLRYEIGVLEESRGDLRAASSEYLAAFDIEPDFREPLEALARLMARSGDERGIGKVLESLVESATDPLDAAPALWELAAYRAEVQGDLASARGCLERALATNPEDAAAWLGLELIAIKFADHDAQARALEARARLSRDPTVQATLLVEVAALVGAGSEHARAIKLLDAAAALDSRARFRSRLAMESVARSSGALELQAVALEAQAELVVAALADEARGDRDGVPRTVRTPAYAADAWLRASELRRRNADPWGAIAAARAAATQLAGDPLVVRMELAAADAAGDAALALEIARREAERGATGPLGAALWTRIALATEQEGRLAEAARAFGRALELAPGSAVAEACRLPALLSLSDGASVAQAFEASARQAKDADAVRFWVLAAFAWGVRSNNGPEAQRALDAATHAGLEPAYAARVGRALASVASDWAWYEASTVRLYAHETDERRRAVLSFELGRVRLIRGDSGGAEAAFSEIASTLEPQSWLGRVMMAYAGDPERPRARAVARLAELQPDALLGRGLVTVAA